MEAQKMLRELKREKYIIWNNFWRRIRFFIYFCVTVTSYALIKIHISSNARVQSTSKYARVRRSKYGYYLRHKNLMLHGNKYRIVF